MALSKVEATRHNTKAASKNNVIPGSKPPQTPPYGGGGSIHPESISNLDLDNHQSINHNHCSLKDCEPFTEHKFPEAVLEHVQHHFLFEDDGKAIARYGADVMNKAVAIMQVKIEHEGLLNWVKILGAYYRSRCEEVLKGSNPPTGKEREDTVQNLKRYVNKKPKKEQTDHGQKYLDEYTRRRGDNAR